MSVCCRLEELQKDHELCERVCAVYAAQGLKAGAGEAAMVQAESDEESVQSPRKKKRRGSGESGSSATEKATTVFAEVMSAFAPPQKKTITSAEWFSKTMLTDEHKAAVLALLPAAPPGQSTSTLMLASIEKEDLTAAGLSKIQINAWLKLSAAESV